MSVFANWTALIFLWKEKSVNDLQSPGRLVRTILLNCWSLQMSILASLGVLPIFQRHPWLFMPLAGVLWVIFPPLGIFFIVTGLFASFAKQDDVAFDSTQSKDSTSAPKSEKRSPGSRLGVEVGEVVREFFEQPFRNNDMIMPSDLFEDAYLAGYAYHAVKVLSVGETFFSLSKEDGTRFFIVALETICGSEIAGKNMALDQDDPAFKLGEQHAAMFFTAMVDVSRLDESDDVVQRAKEIASNRTSDFHYIDRFLHKQSIEQQETVSNENAALGWAIQKLTLIEYIEGKYFDGLSK